LGGRRGVLGSVSATLLRAGSGDTTALTHPRLSCRHFPA